MSTSRIEVDLSALGRNVTVLRSVLDAARAAAAANSSAGSPVAPAPAARPGFRPAICGVIKQDAYGLGAVRIARKLSSLGVEMLAVYCTDEARALADEPIQTPVLILMPVRTIERNDPVYRLAVRGRVHFTLHDLAQAQELASAAAKLGCHLPVHVQLDTGMSRGGALEDEARKIVEFVTNSQRLTLAGLMTHFSSPGTDDAGTREQARLFRSFIDPIKPVLKGLSPIHVHAANTAATLRSHSLHANMVRIGQGLYGFGIADFTDPLGVEFASFGKQLQPVLRWVSRIVHVHEVPKGWSVGYGRTFKASRPTKVALVPVGYADGYPIGLSNIGRVALTGQLWDRPKTQALNHVDVPITPAFASVIGRVSMDQITIDVTGLPDKLACVGGEVELIGRAIHEPNHLPALAKAAGTITHEMLCKLCPHIERIYTASSVGETEPGPIQLPRAGSAVGGLGGTTALAV